jgi:hypothetical protein
VPLREDPEALLGEPEKPCGRERDDRRRARVAGDQRHLTQAVPGPEDRDPLGTSTTLAAYLDRAAHDHIERVTRVALREHRLAGGDFELVELADQAREDLAGELGEQRNGPERRDDRVHRSLVAGTLDGRDRAVKTPGDPAPIVRPRRGPRHGHERRVFWPVGGTDSFDLVISGGRLAPGRPADVGIREGRIAALGDLTAASPRQKVDAPPRTAARGSRDDRRA